jgi:hypothetical protein
METYFTAFPDSVVNDDLAPTQSPIALVVVSGDFVPADVIVSRWLVGVLAIPIGSGMRFLIVICSSWFQFRLLMT